MKKIFKTMLITVLLLACVVTVSYTHLTLPTKIAV